jgi:hypothetical protein
MNVSVQTSTSTVRAQIQQVMKSPGPDPDRLIPDLRPLVTSRTALLPLAMAPADKGPLWIDPCRGPATCRVGSYSSMAPHPTDVPWESEGFALLRIGGWSGFIVGSCGLRRHIWVKICVEELQLRYHGERKDVTSCCSPCRHMGQLVEQYSSLPTLVRDNLATTRSQLELTRDLYTADGKHAPQRRAIP